MQNDPNDEARSKSPVKPAVPDSVEPPRKGKKSRTKPESHVIADNPLNGNDPVNQSLEPPKNASKRSSSKTSKRRTESRVQMAAENTPTVRESKVAPPVISNGRLSIQPVGSETAPGRHRELTELAASQLVSQLLGKLQPTESLPAAKRSREPTVIQAEDLVDDLATDVSIPDVPIQEALRGTAPEQINPVGEEPNASVADDNRPREPTIVEAADFIANVAEISPSADQSVSRKIHPQRSPLRRTSEPSVSKSRDTRPREPTIVQADELITDIVQNVKPARTNSNTADANPDDKMKDNRIEERKKSVTFDTRPRELTAMQAESLLDSLISDVDSQATKAKEAVIAELRVRIKSINSASTPRRSERTPSAQRSREPTTVLAENLVRSVVSSADKTDSEKLPVKANSNNPNVDRSSVTTPVSPSEASETQTRELAALNFDSPVAPPSSPQNVMSPASSAPGPLVPDKKKRSESGKVKKKRKESRTEKTSVTEKNSEIPATTTEVAPVPAVMEIGVEQTTPIEKRFVPTEALNTLESDQPQSEPIVSSVSGKSLHRKVQSLRSKSRLNLKSVGRPKPGRNQRMSNVSKPKR
ncbi:probable serine/threonine-protein kinase nek3 isoform X2 [Paramacrobiotus metropolitanus]|uniref:probable serine/threonine-protein kinase nek3 isoform X2 n=1 Tax=Paramacrobiotus metropolitanus TaxID=2943436 RepID=UPI002445FF49|nr:probable serine/threonine-protein kinase nek3 isoform X2 [Paramacrobiotus metropolitanus]